MRFESYGKNMWDERLNIQRDVSKLRQRLRRLIKLTIKEGFQNTKLFHENDRKSDNAQKKDYHLYCDIYTSKIIVHSISLNSFWFGFALILSYFHTKRRHVSRTNLNLEKHNGDRFTYHSTHVIIVRFWTITWHCQVVVLPSGLDIYAISIIFPY